MNSVVTPDAERKLIAPGWYKDLSNEDYHGSAGTSSTTLKKLVEKTPAHMQYDLHHPKESSESMNMGTLVHTLVLQPEKFEQEYFVCPSDLRAPTARDLEAKKPSDKTLEKIAQWEAWQRKAEGRNVISQAQFDQASEMAGNVFQCPAASILLQDFIAESSVYWWYKSRDIDDDTQYRTMCKVRPDALDRVHGVVIDLKTTTDASYDGFIRSIQKYYYHLSAAMYLEGVNQCEELLKETGYFSYNKFIFICVESAPPYLCAVYELGEEYLDIGKQLYRRAMLKLHKARQEEQMPGFPSDEIRVLEPPGWASRAFIV